VYYGNSGTEAIEAALKMARYHTGRDKFVAFLGGFHGRTMGALSLTGSKSVQKQGFSPLLGGVTHIPYAYCYRCAYGKQAETCNVECVKVLEETLFKTILPAKEVAAIFVEPVQGEGGYVVPPRKFFDELQAVTRRHGILLVCDEVQSGMGRTGRMFAYQHFGVDPDIVAIAKGIASGMPLSATPSTCWPCASAMPLPMHRCGQWRRWHRWCVGRSSSTQKKATRSWVCAVFTKAHFIGAPCWGRISRGRTCIASMLAI